MKIENFCYLKCDDDLELLFKLISKDYKAMTDDKTLAELNKFKDSAIGKLNIEIKYVMEFNIFLEDEMKIEEK